MRQNLENLVALSAASYARERQNLASILKHEAQLRDSLAKLNTHEKTERIDDPQTRGMREIGADVAWQGWVFRMRKKLNLELAQVLAIKEGKMGRIRKAHAKMRVSQELLHREHRRKSKHAEQVALDTAIFQHVIHKK